MVNLSRINMEICDILGIFQTAPRIGSEEDFPEGSRYVQFSDTLCSKIEEKLTDCLNDIKDN